MFVGRRPRDGALNAHLGFFPAAIGPPLNLAMIAAVVGLATRFTTPIMALVIGVLVGGLGQLLVQLPELHRIGVPLRPSLEWRHPAVARIARRLWPAVFALAAVQITVVVNTLLASLLPAGTVSYLYYADRVMEFPLGVFGIALATAALPSMSAQASRQDLPALRATLEFALRLSAFVAVAATVGLLLLGGPIVQVLFQRGEFTAAAAALTAQALAGYAVGLPAFSATRSRPNLYALGDTRTPVRSVRVGGGERGAGPGLDWAPAPHRLALARRCRPRQRDRALLAAPPPVGRAARAEIGARWSVLSWPPRLSRCGAPGWRAPAVVPEPVVLGLARWCWRWGHGGVRGDGGGDPRAERARCSACARPPLNFPGGRRDRLGMHLLRRGRPGDGLRSTHRPMPGPSFFGPPAPDVTRALSARSVRGEGDRGSRPRCRGADRRVPR